MTLLQTLGQFFPHMTEDVNWLWNCVIMGNHLCGPMA